MNQIDSRMINTFTKSDMMFYQDRLHTFEYWSKQIRPKKEALAKAGFYYTGTTDKVTCFACGVNVASWEPEDEPWTEHEKWSPACIYLKMTGHDIKEKPMEVGENRPLFGEKPLFGSQSVTGANLFVRRY